MYRLVWLVHRTQGLEGGFGCRVCSALLRLTAAAAGDSLLCPSVGDESLQHLQDDKRVCMTHGPSSSVFANASARECQVHATFVPSPSAALRRSRAFALSATPEKLAGGGATTADYVLDLVSQPAQGNGGEHHTESHHTAPATDRATFLVLVNLEC